MNDRNQPCSCGSGKKTKNCCKSPQHLASLREIARQERIAKRKAWEAEIEERRKLRAAAEKERKERWLAQNPNASELDYAEQWPALGAAPRRLALILALSAANYYLPTAKLKL